MNITDVWVVCRDDIIYGTFTTEAAAERCRKLGIKDRRVAGCMDDDVYLFETELNKQYTN